MLNIRFVYNQCLALSPYPFFLCDVYPYAVRRTVAVLDIPSSPTHPRRTSNLLGTSLTNVLILIFVPVIMVSAGGSASIAPKANSTPGPLASLVVISP